MTPEDFSRLGAHLQSLNPCINQFCQKHGFGIITGASIGRYPRIRIEQKGDITYWIDLWMGLNGDGQRFTGFFPEIPYELSAGASVIEICGNSDTLRYQKSFLIWPSKPFNEVYDALPEALEGGLLKLKEWDKIFLKEHGVRVQLG